MAERKQITLIYRYSDNWIGGAYYILNIIKALKLLEEHLKPELIILHDVGAPIDLIENYNYPYLSFREYKLEVSLVKRIINKLFFYLNGKRVFKLQLPVDIKYNVYPLSLTFKNLGLQNAYYWIPDFQEEYYPEFFSSFQVRNRKSMNLDLLKNEGNIVFSSMNALNDYNKFYPGNKNVKKVLNFASFVDDNYKLLSISGLLEKYNISKPYFIVPNQFWKHKNHFVVLEAISRLKERKHDVQVVFTGKLYDFRNPEYSSKLKKYIEEHDLHGNVRFLGFIDRAEQLKLMAESQSIIQPSLFEGWSTVIEDSKVINQNVIVSDIPLHREQIQDNCIFFNPKDSTDLAEKIIWVSKDGILKKEFDYKKVQIKFAKDLIDLFI